MKKTVLSLATIAAASFLSMAADCSGSNIVPCTTDEDCTVDGEACAIAADATEGQCVTPGCEADADCDLMDTSEGSPVADAAEYADGCEADDLVTIVGFDGEDYCALEPSAEFPCTDLNADAVEAPATLQAGGTTNVCVLADGTCDLETLSCS